MSRPKLDKNFVPVKGADQQAVLMLTKLRAQFVARRTQLSNSIRGFAAEFGFVAPKGFSRLGQLLADIRVNASVPDMAKEKPNTYVIDIVGKHYVPYEQYMLIWNEYGNVT